MQETQGFTKTQLFYIKITAKLPKVGPVSLLIKEVYAILKLQKISKAHGDKKRRIPGYEKRIMCLVLAASLAATMAGCGKQNAGSTAEKTSLMIRVPTRSH